MSNIGYPNNAGLYCFLAQNSHHASPSLLRKDELWPSMLTFLLRLTEIDSLADTKPGKARQESAQRPPQHNAPDDGTRPFLPFTIPIQRNGHRSDPATNHGTDSAGPDAGFVKRQPCSGHIAPSVGGDTVSVEDGEEREERHVQREEKCMREERVWIEGRAENEGYDGEWNRWDDESQNQGEERRL